tara:strand:+ start:2796 stop:3377 length:582 start_codon:yes stop_codon:yes gene_type:complete
MNFEVLIEQYGYVAILIGTFLEGEAILIVAGFLSHQGYLNIYGVILLAFIGAMLGDQLYFCIGRWKGRKFIASKPRLHKHQQRVEFLLSKHQFWLILGFRFIYGIRTVTPFILGTSKVNAGLFFILNMVGALIWATATGAGGYYFGKALQTTLGKTKDYEIIALGILTCAVLVFWIIHFLYRRRYSETKHSES